MLAVAIWLDAAQGKTQDCAWKSRCIEIAYERRVVWTETIREIDKLLAVNITTLEFQPDGPRTRDGASDLIRERRYDPQHKGRPRGLPRKHCPLSGARQPVAK